jgi:DNA gyrase subunit A
VSQISISGRATQGVRVINLREGDAIASVTAVPKTDEEEIAAVATAEGVAEATVEATAEVSAPTENANE